MVLFCTFHTLRLPPYPGGGGYRLNVFFLPVPRPYTAGLPMRPRFPRCPGPGSPSLPRFLLTPYMGGTSSPFSNLGGPPRWSCQGSWGKTSSPMANYSINCLSDPIWDMSKWRGVLSVRLRARLSRVLPLSSLIRGIETPNCWAPPHLPSKTSLCLSNHTCTRARTHTGTHACAYTSTCNVGTYVYW